jgi:trypsin
VYLGRRDFSRSLSDEDAEEFDVIGIYPHPLFTSSQEGNDVSLWRLSRFARADRPVVTMPRRGASIADMVPVGTPITIMGFGNTKEEGTNSKVLLSATIKAVDTDECGNKLLGGSYIPDTQFCGYGDNGTDACQGDSGGPVVISQNSLDVLVGLVSWGVGCARDSVPAVYEFVGDHEQWIADTIQAIET